MLCDLYVVVHLCEKRYMINTYMISTYILTSTKMPARTVRGDLLILLIENAPPQNWITADIKFRTGYKFRAKDDDSAIAYFDSFNIEPDKYWCVVDVVMQTGPLGQTKIE